MILKTMREWHDSRRENRRLREKCLERIPTLPKPTPFSARSFCEALALQLGTPIHILPMEDPIEGLYGDVRWENGAYYIRFNPMAPNQEHTILHEGCHIACNHISIEPPDEGSETVQQLTLEVGDRMVSRFLPRYSYDSPQEREAELLASMLEEIASRETVSEGTHYDGETALDGIEAFFAKPSGR